MFTIRIALKFFVKRGPDREKRLPRPRPFLAQILLGCNKTTNSLKRLNLLIIINQNNLHNLNSRAEIELVYVSPYTPLQSGDALQTLSRQ